MTKAQIEKVLNKNVLPHLFGFVAKGRLLYKKETAGLLRGYYFDQSASNAEVLYVQCFVLPLYVPRSVISFNFGDRLTHPANGNPGWKIGDDDENALLVRRMAEADIAYLSLVDTPCAFAERFSSTKPSDVHTEEAVAYSWLICGNTKRAMESLLRLEQVEANVPWIAELKVRGELIKHLLQSGELTNAQEQLKTWQAESESNLKL